MSVLYASIEIKSLTLKNRIVVSPMCQYSSIDGLANNWHLVHLGSRAVGGAGLIFTEAAAVSPEGRISIADLGIWKDEHIDKLREINDFIHQSGSNVGIQLAHAGRKASFDIPWENPDQLPFEKGGWQTVAPSAVAFNVTDKIPVALDSAGIDKVIKDFKAAAKRAWLAGFDVVELHAAHGYLIHQFLSPISNQRTDGYGGSFENRVKLLLEIVDAVKEVWPAEKPLFVRISATDWAHGGWDLPQSIQLAALLKERGVDLIDTSSGGLTLDQQIKVLPGYQVELASVIKRETGILTGAVGLITAATQAEDILRNQNADLIFMARELLRNPYFALQAATKLGDNVKWPMQYERAKPRA